MPWATIEELPEALRKALEPLTTEQKRKWLDVANACLRDGGEEGMCIAAAWTAARAIGMGEGANAVPGAVLNSLVVGSDGRLPDWIELARTGVWLGHPSGPETITPERLNTALVYFDRHYAANGADLVIDWDHASNVAMLTGVRAPAAGWIDRLEMRNGGTELWGHVRMWTSEAANAITRREYRYVSPSLRFGQPDRVTGVAVALQIGAVALTNRPFLTELEALNASLGGTPRATHTADGGGRAMRLLEVLAAALGKKVEEVASLLGLAQDAEDAGTANAVVALPSKVNALQEDLKRAEAEVAALKAAPKPVVCADVANALGVALDADVTKVNAAILALKAPSGAGALAVRTALALAPDAKDADVLNAIGTLQQSKRKTDAEELVEDAIKAGKVPPAHREFYLREALHDLGAARDVINALPTITAATGLAGKGGAPGGPGTIRPEEREVMGSLGFTEAQMKLGRGA